MSFQRYSLVGYNRAGLFQHTINMKEVPAVLSCLSSLLPLNPPCIQIADYGCSEGLNSMIFLNEVLKKIRENTDIPFHITHTDLPENDWTLFSNLLNSSSESYLLLPNVFSSFISRSFYHQLFPSSSIHLGLSFFSFHYLSEKPQRQFISPTEMDPEYIQQSYKDLRTLLRHRINELVSGGLLLIVAGRNSNTPNLNTIKLYQQTFAALMNSGVLVMDQMKNFIWSIHALKLQEWQMILEDFSGEAEVVKIQENKTFSPFYEKYLEDHDLESYQEETMQNYSILMKWLVFDIVEGGVTEKENAYKSFQEAMKKVIGENADCELYMDTITVILRKK